MGIRLVPKNWVAAVGDDGAAAGIEVAAIMGRRQESLRSTPLHRSQGDRFCFAIELTRILETNCASLTYTPEFMFVRAAICAQQRVRLFNWLQLEKSDLF